MRPTWSTSWPARTAIGIALLPVLLTPAFAARWHWSNPAPHGNDILDMTWYNGLVVQVCDSGQCYTTDDLNLWLARDTHTTNTLDAVAVLGSRLLAVGAGGTVVYSDDGVNFTCTNLLTPNSDWLTGVAASASLAVAVGDEAVIYTSANGASWQRQPSPPQVGANWLRGVAFGNGVFVTVGEGGYLASSTDGTNWTHRLLTGFSDTLNWVAWVSTPGSSNGFSTPAFYAVSDTGKGITSPNGVNWSLLFNPAKSGTTNSLFAIAGDDSTRLFGGDSALFLERPAFYESQTGAGLYRAPAWLYFTALALTNNYLVSGQAGLTLLGTQTNAAFAWSAQDASSRGWLWQVSAVVSNFYVAVGSQAAILTSGNGVDWSIEAVPATNTVSATNTVFFGVGGSTNLLLAVGSAGTVAWSSNTFTTVITTNADHSTSTNQVSEIGLVWNPVPPPTTNDLQGVAFFGSQYYVSGGGGTILGSADGANWTRVPTPTAAFLSALETFSGGLVAVGDQGTILTSTDGGTWVAQSSGTTNWIFRVRNLGGRLVAVGENGTILTSTDGGSWTPQASGTTVWLNDAVMVGGSYYIAGNQGTVLTSTNFADWTPVGTISGNSLYGAAAQNGQLILAGTEGTILRTQVVPITTPVNFLDYAHTPGQDLFLVAGVVDQEFTLDASPDLAGWATGPQLGILDSSGTLIFYINNPTNAPVDQYFRNTLVPGQ